MSQYISFLSLLYLSKPSFKNFSACSVAMFLACCLCWDLNSVFLAVLVNYVLISSMAFLGSLSNFFSISFTVFLTFTISESIDLRLFFFQNLRFIVSQFILILVTLLRTLILFITWFSNSSAMFYILLAFVHFIFPILCSLPLLFFRTFSTSSLIIADLFVAGSLQPLTS